MGRRGEKIACRLLKRRGLKILAKNYRCPKGEADLVALDPSARKELGAETLAFVEVKTHSARRLADPQSAVNADKQRRLRRVAAYYLATHPDAAGLNVRFDVVAIVLNDPEDPEVNYIPDAF